MANLLTRKQVAELIGETPGYVGMYVRRKKLIEENKRIDTDHPTNKAFISKYITKEVVKNSTPIDDPNNDEKESEADKNKVNQGNIDYIKAQYDLKLKMNKLAAETLALEKRKAKLVPTDFIIDVFSTYIKTNITGINNEIYKLFDELIDKFDGDYDLKLKYKKRLNLIINDVFKNNHAIISKEIIERAKEYAINRNW